MKRPVKPKERDTIIRSLRSGVVPAIGLQHIQVGRYQEIRSFLRDIENVADGGASFRLVIGEYGSGKTFFLSLVRSIAIEKGLVAMKADLSPSKRLHGTQDQSRALLSELVASISTRTRQEGGALQGILDRFLSEARAYAESNGIPLRKGVEMLLADLHEYPGGFPFAKVVEIYCTAYETGDEQKMTNALRWLRCEYSTKTDSMRDLGIREFINDRSFLPTLVLYSVLVRKAGYKGLFICLDEMVNLYKITNSISRKANYEEVLNIVNATLQGHLQGFGMVMSGTPEFLTDGSRGLYSYEALRSRLAENTFSKSLGVSDFNSTVLRLPNLTSEEMYLLLANLRNVFALGKEEDYLVPDNALSSYLAHCARKIGESYFRTPRNTIKGFIDMLSVLEQYPDKKWNDMIEQIDVVPDKEPSLLETNSQTENENDSADNDEFANFKL